MSDRTAGFDGTMNPARPELSVSDRYDVAIVVPTVAHPDTLLPTARRLLAFADGLRVLVVFSFNAQDPDDAEEAEGQIGDIKPADGIEVEIIRAGCPIGFGAANNRGLIRVLEMADGCPRLVIFHNDDAHVAEGWLERILAAAETDRVMLYSEAFDPSDMSSRKSYPVQAHGPVGIVGPISNLVAGIQQVRPERNMSPDGAQRWAAEKWDQQRITADFISGFCMGFTPGCIADLMLFREGDATIGISQPEGLPSDRDLATIEMEPLGIFDEDQYPIAGYEDNDVCVRAERMGWRAIVANDVYVSHLGHQTFDRLYPEMQRGMRNRLRYYEKWRPVTQDPNQRVIAVCRLGLEVPNDLIYFRSALSRILQVADGVAILLTSNPLDVRHTMEWGRERQRLSEQDIEMLKACSPEEGDEREDVIKRVEQAFTLWAQQLAAATPEARFDGGDILVEVWRDAGPMNEREERNRSFELGESLDADWLLSFDHDEFVENRVWRRHFDLVLTHPDPLVRSIDFAWLNHWDSPRMCRVDRPWGDDGSYKGGMHGFRLWRVCRRNPRRIWAGTENGLHCGNSPDHDVMAKRVSGIRWRHYGYLRNQDRFRKFRRYQEQDPHPERALVGGDDYSHIIRDENCKMSPYVAVNGLALHMLAYEKEDPDDYARLLDGLRGILDRVVLVWTGTWEDTDKDWLEPLTQEQRQLLLDWRKALDQITEAAEEDGEIDQAAIDGWLEANPRPRFAQDVREDVWDLEWREGQTGPAEHFARICQLFGVQWVHEPLNHHLANARNAGLDALQQYARKEGLGWAMFLDPDESFADPYGSAVVLRRMAEVSDVHGWMFQVTNFHDGMDPTQSESVRISRLVPPLRMSGRVHESFEQGLAKLREAGTEAVFRIAPLQLMHRGLALKEQEINAKLRKYQELLLLQLADNPQDSGAWMSLGLHLLNDAVSDPEREDQAVECFRRGMACHESGYLPFREMAMWHLRKAKVWFGEALRRAGPGMPWSKANAQFYRMLAENIPDMPIMGSARRGVPVCPPIELPEFELAEDIREVMGEDVAPRVLDAAPQEAEEAAEPIPSGGAAPDSPPPV